MEFNLEPYNRNTSNEDLIEDLKRVSRELGKNKLTISDYEQRGNYSCDTYFRHFGSWNKSLKLAGLAISKNHNVPNKELFENMMQVWIRLQRQPKYSDLTSQISQHGSTTYVNRFGSWRKALEAFVKWANEGKIESELHKSEIKVKKQKTSRSINYRLRFPVMRRDNFKCRITGKSPATDPNVILEVDHIIPWDKGGETIMENLQTLAKEINIGKSNLDMFESE